MIPSPIPLIVKRSTIRGKLKIIRGFMKWCLKQGILSSDPARGYELPPDPKTEAHFWSAAECRLIREHAQAGWLDIFDFLRLTGLRSDEFCWLTKADVDFDRPHVKVRAKLCPQTGERWKPKHGNHRIVPMCREALAIARRALAASPGPWLFWAPNTRSNQPGLYRTGRIWAELKRTLERAGITRGTVHTFRHVFCSFMANQNVPPLQVMKIMGHSSLDIILTYYHVTEEELLAAFSEVPFAKMLTDRLRCDASGEKEVVSTDWQI